MKNITFLAATIALTLPFVSGCSDDPVGPELAPASGTVTLDGTAIEGAEIEFVPVDVKSEGDIGGSGALGSTEAEGKFEMYTGSQPGVQPGKYKVRVTKTETIEEGSGNNSKMVTKNSIPPKFNTESELEITIPKEGNESITFDLKSK